MMVAVPKPSRRNPFKDKTLALQFDLILKAYENGHRDVIRENGTQRCMSNSLAGSFWRGYDAVPPVIIPKGTAGWAAYRAGQAQRIIDTERGVYVPPLNSRNKTA